MTGRETLKTIREGILSGKCSDGNLAWIVNLCDESLAESGAANAGNAAAMLKALELVNKIYDLLSKPCIVIEEVRHACQKARAVLISMPQRNCDVGTAEEQWKRFDEFCIAWEESGPDGGCSDGCPCMAIKSKESDGCFGKSGCFAIWAQMPYEEGGAK